MTYLELITVEKKAFNSMKISYCFSLMEKVNHYIKADIRTVKGVIWRGWVVH